MTLLRSRIRIRMGPPTSAALGIEVQSWRRSPCRSQSSTRVAEVHHQHPIGDVFDHRRVVGDEDEDSPSPLQGI